MGLRIAVVKEEDAIAVAKNRKMSKYNHWRQRTESVVKAPKRENCESAISEGKTKNCLVGEHERMVWRNVNSLK